MFRAVKAYDGSDTSKCITLTPGDALSAVHTLDETWFIGFNERTGEIGAFPIDCVEAVGNEYGPLPGEDNEGHKMDEKAIYANVSKQIQARKATEARSGDELGPAERSRTLSAHAKTFDVNKFRGTKPEKTFRLTLVKKDIEESEQAGAAPDDPNDPRRPSLVRPETVFSLGASTDAPVDGDSNGEPKVRFSEVALEHSISADSVASWQDSFEMSYETPQYATPEVKGKGKDAMKGPDDGKYHKLKRSSFQTGVDGKGAGAKEALKIAFAVLSSVIVLCLLFAVLVFSFGYTVIESGIIVSIAAAIIGTCIGLSPLCRCIMALLLPNLISSKSRAVYLIVLLGILFSYPLMNITYNVRETARSLACLTELAENQSKAVQGQLAQPYDDIADYVKRQNRELETVAGEIDGALGKVGAHLTNFYGSLEQVDAFLVDVVKQCKQTFVDAVNRCASECTGASIEGQCLQTCSFMYRVSKECDAIKDARKAGAINDAATEARAAIDGVNNYFKVDMDAHREEDSVSNISTPTNSTQRDIASAFEQKSKDFEISIIVIQKLLSFSVCLLFLQSFWYIRSYVSSDNFDNIYITQDFVALDKQADTSGSERVLPLKEMESDKFVDTSTCRLSVPEMAGFRSGLVQVLLHFLFAAFVILFEFALSHVLVTVREFGEDQHARPGSTYGVNITGSSRAAEFYRILLKGINLDKKFTTSLEVRLCLPEPMAPSVAITVILSVLHVIAFALVVFRGYGMRLRRKIAACYYPEHESTRLAYLHKNILLKRDIFTGSLSQQIKSSHREYMVLQKLSLQRRCVQCLTYMERFVPVLNKCLPKLTKLKCTGCRQRERPFDILLKKCTGEHDGVLCDATYCEDCRHALNDHCPVCLTHLSPN